jgi:hypothetical protein
METNCMFAQKRLQLPVLPCCHVAISPCYRNIAYGIAISHAFGPFCALLVMKYC